MKPHLLLIGLFFSFFLAGCSQLPFLTKKQSALQVNSTPPAGVYLDGSLVGQTPYYDDKLKPGTYAVRLLVDGDPTKDWQTDVTLAPSIVTVLARQFGATSDDSSHYLLALEAINQKDSGQLDVASTPENVIVKVDGRPEGFSPLHLENVTEGDHVLTLTAPGYQELTIKAQTKNGYKLIATAQLARATELTEGAVLDQATPSAQLDATAGAKLTPAPKTSPTPKVTGTLTPTPTKKAAAAGELEPPYVTITETGTGWLRVRSEPEVGDNEVAQVDVGDKFPYLESSGTGWYKIEFESGKQGWIVSRYAKLTE
ncbi:hypothetical protein A2W24_01570 [Microgenomates group bacterium RBG_16_45_19]|nr:MAG: hypothetical protein A2W24_01570 [Microgenomates group bacterium RBG_16_45_19]